MSDGVSNVYSIITVRRVTGLNAPFCYYYITFDTKCHDIDTIRVINISEIEGRL